MTNGPIVISRYVAVWLNKFVAFNGRVQLLCSLSKQFTTSDVLIHTPVCVQTDEGDTEQERRLIYTQKEREMLVITWRSSAQARRRDQRTPCLLNNFTFHSSSCEENS